MPPQEPWQLRGRAPELFERYLVPAVTAPWAADLVAVADPSLGARVLDVACGTGIVARLAAERVGPTGHVVGLDLNPGMLAVARGLSPLPGAPIAWQEASAVALPFPAATFDVVLCLQGLPFFPDRAAALREMHRVLAPGGRLTVSDKTQGVQNVWDYLCNVFGCSRDALRVVSPDVGGAFGSGLRLQYQVVLAVLAARELKRSVRVTLTRQQMFSLGHRPTTWQRVALGAAPDGTLDAVIHEVLAETSRFEDYSEPAVHWLGLLYRCDHVTLAHQVAHLDLNTPCDMRAPGAAWDMYALECAMDELAAKVGIDPVELWLKNYAQRDQHDDKPFSSKALRACYRQGAERFGWARRHPEPRSMREGDTRIGWGMAGGRWDAWQLPAAAQAVLTADGKLTVSSATADIGTGTYTIMTQIAAETLGLPMENVTFTLGDSSLSKAPVEGGSFTAASVGSAVKAVCQEVCDKLFQLARQIDDSPLANAELADVTFTGGHLRLHRDSSRAVALTEVLRQGTLDTIAAETSAGPSLRRAHYSSSSHAAVFAEVKVD
jgi:xanthine dehydrogenase YagR molybdenum-binding subunit